MVERMVELCICQVCAASSAPVHYGYLQPIFPDFMTSVNVAPTPDVPYYQSWTDGLTCFAP